jgi:[ribosomal protein S5]-alanine N-acetyltransferase
MKNQIELTTDRLILKSITPEIIHELFNTKTKEEIITYFGYDENAYNHHKRMHKDGMESFRITVFSFLIFDKETNLPIGECGYHTLNLDHKKGELFYNIRKDENKQKGIMTEALNSVLNFGFTQLNLHRIQAMVAADNIPSIKLLLHFKFLKEGTIREDYVVNGVNEDSDCYSLLKWEWEK